MSKRKNRKYSDDKALSQFKKSVNLKGAGKAFSNANRSSDDKKSDVFFDNLITTEELATIFRVAPQTIRNWIALGKIPSIQIGRRNLFQKRSLQKWLQTKEVPQWE